MPIEVCYVVLVLATIAFLVVYDFWKRSVDKECDEIVKELQERKNSLEKERTLT